MVPRARLQRHVCPRSSRLWQQRPRPTANARHTQPARRQRGRPKRLVRTTIASAKRTRRARPPSGRPRRLAHITTVFARRTQRARAHSGRHVPQARIMTVSAPTTASAPPASGRRTLRVHIMIVFAKYVPPDTLAMACTRCLAAQTPTKEALGKQSASRAGNETLSVASRRTAKLGRQSARLFPSTAFQATGVRGTRARDRVGLARRSALACPCSSCHADCPIRRSATRHGVEENHVPRLLGAESSSATCTRAPLIALSVIGDSGDSVTRRVAPERACVRAR